MKRRSFFFFFFEQEKEETEIQKKKKKSANSSCEITQLLTKYSQKSRSSSFSVISLIWSDKNEN